jgi:hypothetical protein
MSRLLAWLSRLRGRRGGTPAFAAVLADALRGDGAATWRLSTLARSLGPEPGPAPSPLSCHGAESPAPDPKE